MAQDQVEEIKSKTDIVAVISEHIELKKAGRNFKAVCPFHNEKLPSFYVSPELQIFKCFGCHEGGDVIAFLQKYEGLDFQEALKVLADRAGIKLKAYRPGISSEKEKLKELNKIASRFYQYLLLSHASGKKALTYLTKDRGLKLTTIKKFNIGFSPERPDALAGYLVNKKKYHINDLDRAGLVYKRGGAGYDRYAGRVIFPLFDHRGEVAGFAGRVMPGAKRDVGKYINTPETPIYHKSSLLYGLNITKGDIKRKKEAVVTEGELDMISSWQEGVKNVVAIKGTALTEDQLRLLARFTEKLILALDADAAGETAARRSIVLAQEMELDVRVAQLGDYKDPDEMARKDIRAYKKSLKEAVDIWEFIIDSIFSRYEKTASGKAKISREVIPVLASIPDKIVQAHYVKVVADKFDISVDIVTEQLLKAKPQKVVSSTQTDAETYEKEDKTRRQLLEEELLSLAFNFDLNILKDKKVTSLIKTPINKKILNEYIKYTKNKKEIQLTEFAKVLPKELMDAFSKIVLIDMEELEGYEDKQNNEIKLVIRELKTIDIKQKLEVLEKDISKHEKKKDKKNLQKTKKEFRDLVKELSDIKKD